MSAASHWWWRWTPPSIWCLLHTLLVVCEVSWFPARIALEEVLLSRRCLWQPSSSSRRVHDFYWNIVKFNWYFCCFRSSMYFSVKQSFTWFVVVVSAWSCVHVLLGWPWKQRLVLQSAASAEARCCSGPMGNPMCGKCLYILIYGQPACKFL